MCLSPPSPFIEKAIANRLSVLPPNAEAIRHEAKGESSSTSSHGCDFIQILNKTITPINLIMTNCNLSKWHIGAYTCIIKTLPCLN